MIVSSAITALKTYVKMSPESLAGVVRVGSAQAVSNKNRLNRWLAPDLDKITEATGTWLAFILPGGERNVISSDDPGHGYLGIPAQGILCKPQRGGVSPPNSREREKGPAFDKTKKDGKNYVL